MTDAYNRWWVAQMGRPPLPEEHAEYEEGRQIFEDLMPTARRLSDGMRDPSAPPSELEALWSSLAEIRDRLSLLEIKLAKEENR